MGKNKAVSYAGAVKDVIEGRYPNIKKLVPHLPQTIDLVSNAPCTKNIDPTIFRAYDIRGIAYEKLTKHTVYKIGLSIGSIAKSKRQKRIIVGYDGRLSGPDLLKQLLKGLCKTGINVVNIGMVPTPLLYYAIHKLKIKNGIILTGSHNPPEYNGLKIVLKEKSLAEDDIQTIYQRIIKKDFKTGNGTVKIYESICADYINEVKKTFATKKALKIVIDGGNGVAGGIGTDLFKALGHQVIPIYCEIDGRFPNHPADPSQAKNLQTLIEKVKATQADVGFAFDGDGDRLGLVASDGVIIAPDRQIMLLAQDILKRHPKANIIYDVKCSRNLKTVIQQSGGKPVMWKTGHSLIKQKMQTENALLAGEMSGHIFIKERWYGFDDALYTAVRLLEIMLKQNQSISTLFDNIPNSYSTEELRMPLTENLHTKFMSSLKKKLPHQAEIIEIDGLRVEFSNGWGLVRPSNTTPNIIFRFEADTPKVLADIQNMFRDWIWETDLDSLAIPF